MKQYLTHKTYWNLIENKIIYEVKKVKNFIIARETYDTGTYITENMYKSVIWKRFIRIKKNKNYQDMTTTCESVYIDQFGDIFSDNQFDN